MITVDTNPEALEISLGEAAVLVVDMQNDFGAEGGMFDRAGIDIGPIQAAVRPTAQVLDAARAAGVRVIYLKMGLRPDLSDAGAPGSPNRGLHERFGVGQAVTAPDGTASGILVRDTWNTAILDELAPQPADIIVSKQRFSGFYQTDLDTVLRSLRIKYLVVTGCTTSVCVESTVRDAMFRDYMCLLLEDCMAEPVGADLPRSNHEASLFVLQLLFARVARSEDFLRALGSAATSGHNLAVAR
jgi:ureidoacrylate peracid hydrolase